MQKNERKEKSLNENSFVGKCPFRYWQLLKICCYSGFTWMTFTCVSLCLVQPSSCCISSRVIKKRIEEELKVTFFLGLSPAFWDMALGLTGFSWPTAGLSFRWFCNLKRRMQKSCIRHRRNYEERKVIINPQPKRYFCLTHKKHGIALDWSCLPIGFQTWKIFYTSKFYFRSIFVSKTGGT